MNTANEFRNYYKKNVGSKNTYGLNAKKCTFSQTGKGDLVQWVVNGKSIQCLLMAHYVISGNMMIFGRINTMCTFVRIQHQKADVKSISC